jgi:hypothetical protein
MKKSFSSLVLILYVVYGFAQAPQKMSYQCVVRTPGGGLAANKSIGLRISILQGSASGNVVYQETYYPNPQTNANGLLTVEIGGGQVMSGNFTDIDWSYGTYFIKVETDPTGGTAYTISGTSQLLSVPYALHAKTAENGFSGNYNDLMNLPVLFDGTWTQILGKPSFATVATSGSYNDLTNRPSLFDGSWASLSGKPSFTNVATSGSYNDLINRPALFDGTWASLSGKPTFAAVASSGNYNDLTNRPVLFDGSWSSLSGKPTFATVATSGNYTYLSNRPVIPRETTDEFTATSSQTVFTLNHAPSGTGNLRMYINGIRISNAACSNSGGTATYIPSNNGSYILMAGDRIQFDYSY